MASLTNKFVPIHSELKAAVEELDEHWTNIYYPLLESVREDYETGIGLQCIDSNTATQAALRLVAYQQFRARLDFRLQEFGDKGQSLEMIHSDPEYREYLTIHIDDYLPGEFVDVISHILWAATHYYPFSEDLISSIKTFVETFASFDILAISLISNNGAPDSRDVVALHKLMLKVGTLLVTTVLDHKPIGIVVGGVVKHLTVSVENCPLKLSPTQTRGIAALALLDYNHWFSVEEFCTLAFPGNETYEPRKQFDAALSVLKQYAPFGWDADEGIRRIKGAVITSAVDKAVLRAHLNQKKAA